MSAVAPSRRFEGQKALVTGGTLGIGAAIARRLASEGANVLVTSRSGDADAVSGTPRLRRTLADSSDMRAMATAVAIAADGDGLDVCVANAGIVLVEDFLTADPQAWEGVIRANLLGVMVTLRVAAEAMTVAGHVGKLVAVASVAGLRGEAHTAAYSASKAGVIAVIESLAAELAPLGITVNAVAPGEIATRLQTQAMEDVARLGGRPAAIVRDEIERAIPLARLGEPEDVAAAVAFLASRDADYITGTTLRVDGGSWLV